VLHLAIRSFLSFSPHEATSFARPSEDICLLALSIFLESISARAFKRSTSSAWLVLPGDLTGDVGTVCDNLAATSSRLTALSVCDAWEVSMLSVEEARPSLEKQGSLWVQNSIYHRTSSPPPVSIKGIAPVSVEHRLQCFLK
jgi:hypothetical protein